MPWTEPEPEPEVRNRRGKRKKRSLPKQDYEERIGRPPAMHMLAFPEREELVGEPGGEIDYSVMGCTHGRGAGTATTATVMGVDRRLPRPPPDMPLCRDCYAAWLSRYAILCRHCGKIVRPGDPIAQPGIYADRRRIVHWSPECSLDPARLCGIWGMGRLVSLHEMDPKNFPPGTMTVADHGLRLVMDSPVIYKIRGRKR